MKRLFKLRHPKLFVLFLSIILAYLLFNNQTINEIITSQNLNPYLEMFIAGFFFSFGFTTPFSVGFMLTSNIPNILYSAIIGGIGSTISTLIIFKWLKFSFEDEIEDLEKEYYFKKLILLIDKEIPRKIRIYLAYSIVGLILASPIPNEFGTFMLAGMKHISAKILTILTFLTTTLGIYIILALS